MIIVASSDTTKVLCEVGNLEVTYMLVYGARLHVESWSVLFLESPHWYNNNYRRRTSITTPMPLYGLRVFYMQAICNSCQALMYYSDRL